MKPVFQNVGVRPGDTRHNWFIAYPGFNRQALRQFMRLMWQNSELFGGILDK